MDLRLLPTDKYIRKHQRRSNNGHICFSSNGVTFYNQLSEMFTKRQQEIIALCKKEKEELDKIEEKAKKFKGVV